MRLHTTAKVGLAVLVGLSLAATGACGKSKPKPVDGNGDQGGVQQDNLTGADEQKQAVKGGILKIIGQGDVSNLDPATSYEVIGWGFIERAITRQLMSYPNATQIAERDTPTPDLADGAPTISSDGLTYTFKLKPGVKYAAPINRAIVANDFIREIKRLCDPNNPSGGLTYFAGTIKGLAEFCGKAPDDKGVGGSGFLGVATGSASKVEQYINSHDVPGLKANGDNELVITLKVKAGDFLNILATPFASPVPAESLKYIADSAEFRQHFPASGPYKIAAYKADEFIHIRRNENQKDGDALRAANVDGIDITTNAANDATQQTQVEGGGQDLYFGGNPPVEAINRLRGGVKDITTPADKRLHIQKGSGCASYVVFNTRRPNSPGGKALQNPKVRQAINYAVDKVGFLKVVGGTAFGTPYGQILTSPLTGYKKADPYATDGSRGNPTKAKQLLKDAGYPNGISLDYIYRPKRKGEQVFIQLKADLARAGITLVQHKVPDKDYYGKHISNPAVNDWDMTTPAWCPDWNGNGARTFFLPLLDGRSYQKGTTNYGGYNNDAVNTDVDNVLKESDTTAVANGWAAIDAKVMQDAPWVPLAEQNAIVMLSSRVKGYVFFPFSASADVTNIWLKK
jgi:peptide/nickel transport system substrate-binding protein